ncbi:MAG: hypothetical protein COA83_09150 [Methylophaga sp.]|nr:MAG: hypothetical protein COA83_09150 [Methylophaga sp.]
MSLLVLQIIIKQWDKSQRTQKHVEERAKIANHHPIIFPPAFYALDQQCVIDAYGDDLLENRIRYSQPDINTIKFDHFQVSLSNNTLQYNGAPNSDSTSRTLGPLDNRWIQCEYNWRYSVYQGGLYYWLYEEVTLNAINLNRLDENIFMNSEPDSIILTG